MKCLLLSTATLLVAGAVHAQTAPAYLLSGEADNAQAEEKLFPHLAEFRQTDEQNARTGQTAIRLGAQASPAILSSALLPVRQG